MSEDDRIAKIARALGHPARVGIVRMLAGQAECSGAEVFSGLPLAQSTISEHLRVLKEAGLVAAKAVGTGTVYCLDPKALSDFAAALSGIVPETSPCMLPGGQGC